MQLVLELEEHWKTISSEAGEAAARRRSCGEAVLSSRLLAKSEKRR